MHHEAVTLVEYHEHGTSMATRTAMQIKWSHSEVDGSIFTPEVGDFAFLHPRPLVEWALTGIGEPGVMDSVSLARGLATSNCMPLTHDKIFHE